MTTKPKKNKNNKMDEKTKFITNVIMHKGDPIIYDKVSNRDLLKAVLPILRDIFYNTDNDEFFKPDVLDFLDYLEKLVKDK
jgi:hypothetical protein